MTTNLNPDWAYLGRSMLLPKDSVPEQVIKGTLRFGEGKDGKPRILVEDAGTHLKVPVNSFSKSELLSFGIPKVVDTRPTQFKEIDLIPKPEFSLRENQLMAWEALKHSKSGILNLACGKGKTILGWLKAYHEGVTTLIVSPQKAHLQNWLNELETFFDFYGEIGWIQGKKFEYQSDICMATVQTLARREQEGKLPENFYTHFGLVIYDECHCMAAEMFVKAADITTGIRIGLSATPNRMDRNEGIFMSHLGKVFFSDISQDLSPTFYLIETGTFFTETELRGMKDRGGQLNVGLIRQQLARSDSRNFLIRQVIDSCLSNGRTVYALSHSVEHVETLHERYPKSTMIHGGVKSDDRLDRLHGSDLVFATIGVGKEAYNRKDLDTLLLLTPFSAKAHSAVTFQQSVGRILREHPGKKPPCVFLFLDSSIDICKGMIFSLVREAKKNGYAVKREWRPTDVI